MYEVSTKREKIMSSMQEKTQALTTKQQAFFDVYIKHRSIAKVIKELDITSNAAYSIYRSRNVQAALKEFNQDLQDKVVYDTATIIDKLWEEYADEETPKNVKVQILVWLGKHIGMWANSLSTGDKDKSTVTYNIVNYNIEKEIEKNMGEVEKIIDTTELDLSTGIVITDY